MSSTYSFGAKTQVKVTHANTSFVSASSSSTAYDSVPPHNPWLGAGPGRRCDEDDRAFAYEANYSTESSKTQSGGGGWEKDLESDSEDGGSAPEFMPRERSSNAYSSGSQQRSQEQYRPPISEIAVLRIHKARLQGKYYNTKTGRILAFNAANKKKYTFYDSHVCGEPNSDELNRALERCPGVKLNDPSPPRQPQPPPQQPQQPPQPQPSRPPQPQQHQKPQWKCACCGVLNDSNAISCSVCTAHAPETQADSCAASASKDDASKNEVKLWASCYNYKLTAFKFGRYKRSENYTYSKCNEQTCYVCLEEYEDDDDITIATCDHYFHSHCLEEWLKVHHSKNTCAPSCMVCHKTIDKRH